MITEPVNNDAANAVADHLGHRRRRCRGAVPGGAARCCRQAALVVGGTRHLALADALIHGDRLSWPSPMSAAFHSISGAAARSPVVVLASGDPFCYGVGTLLAGPCAGRRDRSACPRPPRFRWRCARLGWPLQAVRDHFCLRPPFRRARAAAAAGRAGSGACRRTPDTRPRSQNSCATRGFGLCACMCSKRLAARTNGSRSTQGPASPPTDIPAQSRWRSRSLPDRTPASSRCPPGCRTTSSSMTARSPSARSAPSRFAALAPRAGEMLWDLGCGAGSVAIEWMLAIPPTRPSASSNCADRAARARRQCADPWRAGLHMVTARRPAPGRAAAAGCRVHRRRPTGPCVIDTAWVALRAGGRMVVNAVTTETEARLVRRPRMFGGTLTRLSVERLDTLGPHHVFRPAIAVTQWAATKP